MHFQTTCEFSFLHHESFKNALTNVSLPFYEEPLQLVILQELQITQSQPDGSCGCVGDNDDNISEYHTSGKFAELEYNGVLAKTEDFLPSPCVHGSNFH